MTTANREIKSRQIGAHMMALLVCTVWATTFVCSKELLAYYTPAQVMLMRFVLAYFVLWLLRPRPLRWQGRGELTFLLMGLISFVYVVLIKKQPLTVRREGPKLLGAVCETAGQFAYVFAIAANAIAAAPIFSSYCLASVLWSRIFLTEKLSWKHYACILLAAAGIIILGVLDEIA